LPGRGEAVGSSEMISGPKMKEMVKEIRNRYKSRIIIFDMPPILAADDVLASTSYFDAALLVVEEGGNTPDEVKKAMQMLSGVNLLGTVLNKSLNPPDHQTYY
jgi:Mrp family chromosome partitioning ATPase